MPEKEYIEREKLKQAFLTDLQYLISWDVGLFKLLMLEIDEAPAADVSPVRHGRWLYEVRKENVNFRWNVTAECSECCDNRKEIWGGFFPNVPDCIARNIALQNAKQIKLDNYCPHCGAKMDLKEV